MILVNRVPSRSLRRQYHAIELPVVILFLVVMIPVGRLGGFPLWSLPYVGIVVVIAGYLYLFQWVAALVTPSLISNFPVVPSDPSAYLLLEVVSTGMLWLMLFCLTLLVVALLAVFNRFQPLLKRVRHDWTQLSFILYGESVFALVLLFENHRFDLLHDRHPVLSGCRCLVLLALFCPMATSAGLAGWPDAGCGIVALGNWPVSPGERWILWASCTHLRLGACCSLDLDGDCCVASRPALALSLRRVGAQAHPSPNRVTRVGWQSLVRLFTIKP
jgi:hypothetical protein